MSKKSIFLPSLPPLPPATIHLVEATLATQCNISSCFPLALCSICQNLYLHEKNMFFAWLPFCYILIWISNFKSGVCSTHDSWQNQLKVVDKTQSYFGRCSWKAPIAWVIWCRDKFTLYRTRLPAFMVPISLYTTVTFTLAFCHVEFCTQRSGLRVV